MNAELSFIFKHNGSTDTGGHRDVIIYIDFFGVSEIVDSYYIIDNMRMSNNVDVLELPLKVNLRIEKILKKTIEIINNIGFETLYLPLDLSDEYVTSLRFKKLDIQSIEVDYGLSRDNGFAVNLNEFESWKPNKSFQVLGGPICTTAKSLLRMLQNCLLALNAPLA